MSRQPELRVVSVVMVTRFGNTFTETQRRAVYRRTDGTEFVVLRNRQSKARRFTLDTRDTIFFTSGRHA